MSMLKVLFEFIVITAVLMLFLLYSPVFLDCNPTSYSVNLPKSFHGALAKNEKLSKAEKFLEGKVLWPESLAVFEGSIYTGVSDGHIVKITGDKVEPVLRTGKCEGPWQESECGRPLGMRFTKDGTLYVVDANFGLLSVDVKKGKFETILPSTKLVEGHSLSLLNDIVINDDGMMYLTQSTTKWKLTEVVLGVLDHDCSGRLLSYNPKTKEVKVLARGLGFANGVELSHDGKRLLVAECSNNQIMQYHLSGPLAGKFEPFISSLPGEPDNIRRSQKGGYWVALNSARTQEKPALTDMLAQQPAVRKLIMRLIHTTGSVLTFISEYVPSPAFKHLAFNVKTGRFIINLIKPYGMIVRVSDDGQILESLHSPDGTVAHSSEVLEHEGHLYVGSWRNNFIAKLKA